MRLWNNQFVKLSNYAHSFEESAEREKNILEHGMAMQIRTQYIEIPSLENSWEKLSEKVENKFRELGGFSIAQSVFGRTALEKYEKPSSARVIKSPAQSQGFFLRLRSRR